MLEQFSRFGRQLFLQGVNSSHSGNMSVHAGRGQGTRQFRCGPDVRIGLSVDFQPGSIVQDAFLPPPSISPRGRGGCREMVISLRCRSRAVLSLDSSRMERMSVSEKAATHPRAATIQTAPVLSAKEARISPITNSANLDLFISLLTFLFMFVPVVFAMHMLASGSDKGPRLSRPKRWSELSVVRGEP
jgi:hypothetical protein